MIRPVRIAPSILAADFSRLGEEIARVAEHVDMVHIDVMDGHFVPNVSIGPSVVKAIRPVTALPFDCHLMMTNPEPHLEALRVAGADLVTVHIEAHPDPTGIASRARDLGLGFGLVLNPSTPFDAVAPYVELTDMLVVMSVQPGFGGQSFIESVLPKLEAARRHIDARALPVDLQIDGGVGLDTVAAARRAGADVFVAGSAVFGAADPVDAVVELRRRAEQAWPV